MNRVVIHHPRESKISSSSDSNRVVVYHTEPKINNSVVKSKITKMIKVSVSNIKITLLQKTDTKHIKVSK